MIPPGKPTDGVNDSVVPRHVHPSYNFPSPTLHGSDSPEHDPDAIAAVVLCKIHEWSFAVKVEVGDARYLKAVALRAIAAMVPEQDRELYDLCLATRDNGQRGEPGTLAHLHAYAARHGLGISGVYARMDRLARTIRQHPWFDEVTAPFRPLRRAA